MCSWVKSTRSWCCDASIASLKTGITSRATSVSLRINTMKPVKVGLFNTVHVQGGPLQRTRLQDASFGLSPSYCTGTCLHARGPRFMIALRRGIRVIGTRVIPCLADLAAGLGIWTKSGLGGGESQLMTPHLPLMSKDAPQFVVAAECSQTIGHATEASQVKIWQWQKCTSGGARDGATRKQGTPACVPLYGMAWCGHARFSGTPWVAVTSAGALLGGKGHV